MADKIFDVFMYLVLGFFVLVFGAILYFATGQEVIETYSVGCEVSQMAYAEEQVSRSSSRPVYKMGIRNDDFATTLDINSTQFAQFAVGDVVEVEVVVIECRGGVLRYEYELLGPVIE